MAVSNFQIELSEKGAYRAGGEISGHVILNVWSAIEISHIELLLQGRGTLRIFKDTSTFLEMPKHEVYLKQKILLMSPTCGAHTVVLQPGRYESAFKYQLPDTLPPSVAQQELRHGCVFDISYTAQANMCRMRRSSVIIIKSTRRGFVILPDHLTTSMAHQPISHTEYVKLFCLSTTSNPAKVTVHLNRGIFNPGENVKLKVVVTTEKSTCVQSVCASLEQVTTFNNDMKKLRRTLVRTGEAHGHHLSAATVGATFVMPVPTNIVPSDLPHCHLLDNTYIVKVIVSFKKLAGSLSIRVPITVTSQSTHEQPSHRSLFSQRMTHFRSFGKPALNTTISSESDNSLSQQGDVVGRHLDDQVVTTYKTPVPCCACCLACMGVGICQFEEK